MFLHCVFISYLLLQNSVFLFTHIGVVERVLTTLSYVAWTGFILLKVGTSDDYFERGNKSSCLIKGGQIIDHISDC
jgi:hypothetical protein